MVVAGHNMSSNSRPRYSSTITNVWLGSLGEIAAASQQDWNGCPLPPSKLPDQLSLGSEQAFLNRLALNGQKQTVPLQIYGITIVMISVCLGVHSFHPCRWRLGFGYMTLKYCLRTLYKEDTVLL